MSSMHVPLFRQELEVRDVKEGRLIYFKVTQWRIPAGPLSVNKVNFQLSCTNSDGIKKKALNEFQQESSRCSELASRAS